MCHIASCLWIMIAQFNNDLNKTWLVHHADKGPSDMYIVAFYFICTTITTVGYGDISIVTTGERIFCAVTMILGVVAFSFASGSLASIL